MDAEPVLYREEGLTIMGLIGDIFFELKKIKRLLEDDGEEEEEEEDAGE